MTYAPQQINARAASISALSAFAPAGENRGLSLCGSDFSEKKKKMDTDLKFIESQADLPFSLQRRFSEALRELKVNLLRL